VLHHCIAGEFLPAETLIWAAWHHSTLMTSFYVDMVMHMLLPAHNADLGRMASFKTDEILLLIAVNMQAQMPSTLTDKADD